MQGQNSPEEMIRILNKYPLKARMENKLIPRENIARFYTVGLVGGIRSWMLMEENITSEEAEEFYFYLISHSVLDIIQR